MDTKRQPGRPAGEPMPERPTLRLPAGTLARIKAIGASGHGDQVAYLRRAVMAQIDRDEKSKDASTENAGAA